MTDKGGLFISKEDGNSKICPLCGYNLPVKPIHFCPMCGMNLIELFNKNIDSEQKSVRNEDLAIYNLSSYFLEINPNSYICDILDIFATVDLVDEPEIPFPQADDFNLFIEICRKLNETDELHRHQIMELFDLKPRRYSFYISAGEYLNLIYRKSRNVVALSDFGFKTFNLPEKERNLAIIKEILKHEPFYNVFSSYASTGSIPDNHEIFKTLKKTKIYNVNSEVTLSRRSSTVSGWINWIVDFI